MLRKTALTAVVGVAATLAAVPVAWATPPTITPVPFTTATGRFCPGFDVTVSEATNKEKAITFSSGATIITGAFAAELTNLSNDKTVLVKASGPVFISSTGTSVTLRGQTLLFGEAGFFGPGAPPTLQLVSGVVALTIGPGGVTNKAVTGVVDDLCPVLADP
jgi:hypothetical protein